MGFYLSGDKAFSGNVPDRYRKYLLPAAKPLFAGFAAGDILLQQLDGITYYVRYDRSFTGDVLALEFSTGAATLSLLYILEGTVTLGHAVLSAGSCYLLAVGPSAGHSIMFGKGECRIVQIDVADALRTHAADYGLLDGLYKAMSDPAFGGVMCNDIGNIDFRMLMLLDMLLKGSGTPWETELLVQSTASGLMKLFVTGMEATAAAVPHDARKLAAVREYVVANIGRPLRMAELAKIYGGSAAKLNKQYRKHFGGNLQHFIHGCKMDHALMLLHDKKITVNEVAELTGYNNANNFTRAFTAHFGYTPSSARSSATSENEK